MSFHAFCLTVRLTDVHSSGKSKETTAHLSELGRPPFRGKRVGGTGEPFVRSRDRFSALTARACIPSHYSRMAKGSKWHGIARRVNAGRSSTCGRPAVCLAGAPSLRRCSVYPHPDYRRPLHPPLQHRHTSRHYPPPQLLLPHPPQADTSLVSASFPAPRPHNRVIR